MLNPKRKEDESGEVAEGHELFCTDVADSFSDFTSPVNDLSEAAMTALHELERMASSGSIEAVAALHKAASSVARRLNGQFLSYAENVVEWPVLLSAGHEQRGLELGSHHKLPIGAAVGYIRQVPSKRPASTLEESAVGFWRKVQGELELLREALASSRSLRKFDPQPLISVTPALMLYADTNANCSLLIDLSLVDRQDSMNTYSANVAEFTNQDSPPGFFGATESAAITLRLNLLENQRISLADSIESWNLVTPELMQKITLLPPFGKGDPEWWFVAACDLATEWPEIVPNRIDLSCQKERGYRSKWKTELRAGFTQCWSR